MSEREKYEVAKAYVDTQIQTMRSHGAIRQELSPEQYNNMVQKVAKTVVS